MSDPPTRLSNALEDYLETIYRLIRNRSVARVRDIAKARDVKPASVSPALKRLHDMGLVEYVQREFVSLTPAGEREAQRIFSRHRVLTRFFVEVLNMEAAAADEDACVMEHGLSDQGMDRLVRFFEFLKICPSAPPDLLGRFSGCPAIHGGSDHGDQACIQCSHRKNGKSCRGPNQAKSLADVSDGELGRVTHIDATGLIRQRLLDIGILPDTVIHVERSASDSGTCWVQIHGSRVELSQEEAEAVRVEVT